VLYAVIAALYSRNQWDDLRDALVSAQRGDARGVLRLNDQFDDRRPDGTYGNLIDLNLAVNCADRGVVVTDAQIRASLARWRTAYPMFGSALALTLLGCANWTAQRTPLPKVGAPTAATILVVGTRHDPATPYASAQRLRAALGHAVLLSWDGDGHTAYPKTTCVANAVDAFLLAGKLPTGTATCPTG
jgi:pimeloyl-ACP methyl ester carboxylesterase